MRKPRRVSSGRRRRGANFAAVKDYEDAVVRPRRGADHNLGGIGEVSYQAGHHATGDAGGAYGHPLKLDELESDLDDVEVELDLHEDETADVTERAIRGSMSL